MGKIRVKAKSKSDGIVDVKCLVSHPMETGRRKDKKTGKNHPEHFIQNLTVSINGKIMVDADINSSVSKNPYFRFRVKGTKGDKVDISWKDNKGKTASKKTKVR